MGPGKPMADRTTAEVVLMFVVVPPLIGTAILIYTLVNVVARSREFTAADWFWQVAWFGLLGVGLAVGLPAAGWQEIQRRRALRAGRDGETPEQGPGQPRRST
jgi:hypothetical protein